MKLLDRFSRNKIQDAQNYLTLTPTRLIPHEIAPEGHIRLLIPRFTSRFGKKLLGRRFENRPVRMNLDELGSAVWLQINGKSPVGEICDILTTQFGEKIHPTEERVTKFLTQLYLNKYITFKELDR